MSLFEFTIFDKHERQSIVDGELHTEPIDDNWYRFKMVLNLSEINITCYKQYVLFDNENNPINCLKIYLTDGSVFFSPHSIDKFKEMYVAMYKTNEIIEK